MLATDLSAIIVIVPLLSIIDDQLRSNDFGLKAVTFERNLYLLRCLRSVRKRLADSSQTCIRQFANVIDVENDSIENQLISS